MPLSIASKLLARLQLRIDINDSTNVKAEIVIMKVKVFKVSPEVYTGLFP